jgi:hypothetical protein
MTTTVVGIISGETRRLSIVPADGVGQTIWNIGGKSAARGDMGNVGQQSWREHGEARVSESPLMRNLRRYIRASGWMRVSRSPFLQATVRRSHTCSRAGRKLRLCTFISKSRANRALYVDVHTISHHTQMAKCLNSGMRYQRHRQACTRAVAGERLSELRGRNKVKRFEARSVPRGTSKGV